MYSYNKQIPLRFAILMLLVFLIYGFCLAGFTAVQTDSNEKKIPSIELSGVPCVSIRAVCEAAGYSPRWDTGARKFTCAKGKNKLVFSEGIPFYYFNGSLFQMSACPFMHESSLYLQSWICASSFERFENKTVEWIPQDSVIVIRPAVYRHDVANEKNIEPHGTQTAPEDTPIANSQIIKTIVIDPGHGGKDPGAIGSDGTREKDIVLSLAVRVGEMLKKKSPCQYT